VGEQHAGQQDPLLLAAGKHDPVFSRQGAQPVRHMHYFFCNTAVIQRFQAGFIRKISAQGEVFTDGGVEQMGVLQADCRVGQLKQGKGIFCFFSVPQELFEGAGNNAKEGMKHA